MKTLMNDAFTALSAIPELKWVDDNLGQLNQENPPVTYPCALIGIGNINQADYNSPGQVGDLILEITLVCPPSPQSEPENPQKIHAFAETVYDLIQKIDTAIYRLEGELYGPLGRIKITADTSIYPARFILSYSAVVYE